MNWKLAEAKNRFSEVVNLALTQEPQRVTKRDEAVIVLSEVEYQRLLGDKPSFIDYISSAPSLEGVNTSRDGSPMRAVDL